MKPNRKEYIVKDQPNPCPECPQYKTCRKLCDRAERWVNQDTVGANSNVLLENAGSGKALYEMGGDFLDFATMTNSPSKGNMDSTTSQEAWEKVRWMRLSDKVTRFIYSYYMLGKRIRDIAIEENASSQAIDKRHVQAKTSIRNRLKRAESWKASRESMKFRSINHYDMSALFFGLFYPRRIVSRIVGAHISTVMAEVDSKINNLKESW